MIPVEQFIGKSKRKAQDLAENSNMIFRLIRIDDQQFLPYPEEAMFDRVCVEIDNGFVSKAAIQ